MKITAHLSEDLVVSQRCILVRVMGFALMFSVFQTIACQMLTYIYCFSEAIKQSVVINDEFHTFVISDEQSATRRRRKESR